MSYTTRDPFYVAGLSIRTSNDPGKAEQDIPMLWARLKSSDAASVIPGIDGTEICCVYTDYEGDHTRPYTVVLGYRVNDPAAVPAPYRCVAVPGGHFEKITAAGRLADGIVFKAWLDIWAADLDRAFTADYEVYGDKARDPEAAEIDIFIAVK